jgi:hypothetical protein
MIFNFLLLKILSKKDNVQQKNVFARPWSFDCEKSLALLICEKYLVKIFGFTLVSSSCLPFYKVIFSRNIV